MKKLLLVALLIGLLTPSAEAITLDKTNQSTTAGGRYGATIRHNTNDTTLALLNISAATTVTLENHYRSLVAWSDSDFVFRVNDGVDTFVSVKSANGYYVRLREFDAGTQLIFDVSPAGSDAAGIGTIYGHLERR